MACYIASDLPGPGDRILLGGSEPRSMKLPYKLAILTLGFSLTVSPLLPEQSDNSGKVVGIIGQWNLLDPKKGEKPGAELHFGYTIGLNSCVVGDGGTLTVQFGTTPNVYTCEGKADPPCEQPIGKKCARHIVPQADKSWTVSLAEAFHTMFNDTDRYVTPVSRGLEPHLVDAVLAVRGERVDLAPAFTRVDSGTYKVRIEALSQQKPTSIVQVEWTGKGPASVAVSGIRPGLYRLVLLNAQTEVAGPDAWVLVDAPERFAQDSASFHSAEEETKSWPDEVDPRVPGAVLRAYLDTLAKTVQPGR